MRNSLVKLTQASLYLLVVLTLLVTAKGQTDSCSVRVGDVAGDGLSGTVENRLAEWCNATPGDVYRFPGRRGEIVCRHCLPGATRRTTTYMKSERG